MPTKTDSAKFEKLDGELTNLAKFGSELRSRFADNDISTGIVYIANACHSYRYGLPGRTEPQSSMDTGLIWIYNGFIDAKLPQKAGKELKKASSIFNRLSVLYYDIYCNPTAKSTPSLTAVSADTSEGALARMHLVMKYVSYGLDTISSIPLITNANEGTSEAASFTVSLLKEGALNAINRARMYNSEYAYAAYGGLNAIDHVKDEFKNLSDERKFGILLDNDELKEFLRKNRINDI